MEAIKKDADQEKPMKINELQKKLLRFGIKVNFEDRHYTKAHRTIKTLLSSLIYKLESNNSALDLTTQELEYAVHHLHYIENTIISNLVGKLLDEIECRKKILS